MEAILVILVVLFLTGLYFLPAIVASHRCYPNRTPIFVINLFLGWTFLVWVISLAWACSRISDEDMAKINEERRTKKETRKD